MQGKEEISLNQFTLLVILFSIGSSILLVPTSLAAEAQQDAWITSILGICVGLMLTLLYSNIGQKFESMTIVQYSEKILGKWLGKIISCWFCTYAFILAGIILKNIGYFISTFFMPETPIEVIIIIYTLLLILSTRLGIETIARSAEILFIFIIVLYLVPILGLLPEVEFTKLQPILEEGIRPIIRSLMQYIGSPYLELVIFLMIFPMISQIKKAKKAFLIGTLVGGISIMIPVIFCLLVLGPDMTALHIFSGFTVVKKINIGEFLKRVEALVAIITFISIFFKAAVCFYASVLGFSQVLNLKSFKFLTFPMGIILVVFSMISSPNITYANYFFKMIWTPYALITGLFLPLILLFIVYIRKKFNKNRI